MGSLEVPGWFALWTRSYDASAAEPTDCGVRRMPITLSSTTSSVRSGCNVDADEYAGLRWEPFMIRIGTS
jgi:hypothetical protein